MTLSHLQWLSELFNNRKHRAVSLRLLSFLFIKSVSTQSNCIVSSQWPCCSNIRRRPAVKSATCYLRQRVCLELFVCEAWAWLGLLRKLWINLHGNFQTLKTIFCGDLYPDPDPKFSSWNIYCRAMLCVARLMPSCGVRLSVCVSVTFVYSVKMNMFSPSGRPYHSIFSSTKRYGNIPTGTP